MTLIYAHRGYTKGEYKENTINAFRKAFELGVKAIELDVHLTKDNKWLIHHDRTIKGIAINNIRSSEINKINRRGDVQFCFLDEVLEEFQDKIINIELKPSSSKIGFVLAKFISKFGNINNHSISSFKLKSLYGARNYSSDIKLSFISFYSRCSTVLRVNKKIKLYSFNPFYLFLSNNYVSKIHKNGIQIHVWTVNQEKQIQRMLKYNVDAILTDNPIFAKSI